MKRYRAPLNGFEICCECGGESRLKSDVYREHPANLYLLYFDVILYGDTMVVTGRLSFRV